MLFQFLNLKASCIFVLLLPFSFLFLSSLHPEISIGNSDFDISDKISVRESNYELQISVGDRIFVFGKAKGTLDKVKVGMHVLLFSQDAESGVNPNSFTSVSWKKLKDGSIQIQSSYKPWPSSLVWTVYENGQLKMEAKSTPEGLQNATWLGLGFNFPDQSLSQISWKSSGTGFGQWKNLDYLPMADPEVELPDFQQGFFQAIQTVKMEFESITLDIATETPGVFLGLGKGQGIENSLPQLTSDLSFLFNQPLLSPAKVTQSPSAHSSGTPFLSIDPLVLWFHFQ